MKRYWLPVVTGLSLAGSACATGPTYSLAGVWEEIGGPFAYTLRQSGSIVTGTAALPGCTGAVVSGSVHGRDVTLTLGAGAATSTFTGNFVDASHVKLAGGAPNLDEAFTIAKVPPPSPPVC
jgi:hypothetical protein